MGKQSSVLSRFCQWYRCICSNPEEWPGFVISPDRLCRAHRYLLPNFPIFWNWFAVLGRVFVCGCPRGSRCLFRFFFYHLLSTGKKRASNGDLHTESRQSLSCSQRDMGNPTSFAQDVLPVAKKMSQKPVHSGLNVLGAHNVWSLVAKILRRFSSFAECHQYMRMVKCVGYDAMTTGIPREQSKVTQQGKTLIFILLTAATSHSSPQGGCGFCSRPLTGDFPKVTVRSGPKPLASI